MPEPIFSSEDLTVLPSWGAGAIISIRFPANSQQQIIAANAQGSLAQPLTLDECQQLGVALLALSAEQRNPPIACVKCNDTGLVWGGINWYPCHSCDSFRDHLEALAERDDGAGGEATRALEDTDPNVGAHSASLGLPIMHKVKNP